MTNTELPFIDKLVAIQRLDMKLHWDVETGIEFSHPNKPKIFRTVGILKPYTVHEKLVDADAEVVSLDDAIAEAKQKHKAEVEEQLRLNQAWLDERRFSNWREARHNLSALWKVVNPRQRGRLSETFEKMEEVGRFLKQLEDEDYEPAQMHLAQQLQLPFVLEKGQPVFQLVTGPYNPQKPEDLEIHKTEITARDARFCQVLQPGIIEVSYTVPKRDGTNATLEYNQAARDETDELSHNIMGHHFFLTREAAEQRRQSFVNNLDKVLAPYRSQG